MTLSKAANRQQVSVVGPKTKAVINIGIVSGLGTQTRSLPKPVVYSLHSAAEGPVLRIHRSLRVAPRIAPPNVLEQHPLPAATVQIAVESLFSRAEGDYNHRLGQKPSFEEVSPPSLFERLVREARRKEAALQRVYGVEITLAMLAAEVQRINTTTRAPEMLVEIKAALGNDPERFANAVAKPFLVERLLRENFEYDDALHADARRECEKARNELQADKVNGSSPAQLLALLKQTHSNAVTETTWQFNPRPVETNAPATADEIEIKKRFGPDAQIISPPTTEKEGEQKQYFEDLPRELQRVLHLQLRQPGDASAVIETPGGFLLYVCKERTHEMLSVACLSLPKRSYEQWLNEQIGGTK